MFAQRRGLCEISRYGLDPQCRRLPSFTTSVRSRHDGTVTTGIDAVCGGHKGRIVEVKKALYVQYGLAVPDVWLEPIKGK